MRWPRVVQSATLVLALSASTAWAQHTIYVSPDVPTDLGPPLTSYLPWEVIEHRHLAPVPYALEFGVPPTAAIDALEKMDQLDHWLFSVEAPDDLGLGLGGMFAEPADVIHFDAAAGVYSVFFDASCVAGVVPPGSNVDAAYLDSGDSGDLIVSFDVPTTIGGTTFQPSALVRYGRTGGPPCGWTLGGTVIDFAIALASFSPSSANLTGADLAGAEWVLTFDIPADVAPPLITALPGQVVATNGAVITGAPFDDLLVEGVPPWGLSSFIDALACQANPGTIYDPVVKPVGLLLNKAAAPDIILLWSGGSCASGAEDYGIYEGTMANIVNGVYDHVAIDCSDGGAPLQEQITPAAVSSYYLVVPHNQKTEGSYCFDWAGNARPQPALPLNRCVTIQVVTPCP